ncbi:asparagine synthase-related protein [Bacillus daqingensis]|uniref:asparagine synthase (glutamine-hydrolyzing) n=1 Tax=Bacillus daqingensis TaxID=872396 RepID=A0ABV9NSY3_9BACI
MSALAGVIGPAQQESEKQYMLHQLNRFVSDAVHFMQEETIFMACAHQWITEEQPGERLPLWFRGRYLVLTDALIDNRRELFHKLSIDAAEQRQITEAELFAHAFAKWGAELPRHLHGSFAGAVWDNQERKLTLFRDFSGTRSLYYVHQGDTLAFGTTKSLLQGRDGVSRDINDSWMAQFIAIPSMIDAVDMNMTVYKDIQQVPPSSVLTFQGSRVSISPYQLIDPDYKIRLSSDAAYEEAFREIMTEAVTSKMRTRKKVASHLSGGLDSGTVASIAAAHTNEPLQTYSMVPAEGFDNWTDVYYQPDESRGINLTADFSGNIDSKKLSFNGVDPFEKIAEHIELLESPYKFIENFFWLEGVQRQAAKEGAAVMLTGARGNHSVSWGSHRLTYYYYETLLKQMKLLQLDREMQAYCRQERTGRRVVYPFIFKRLFKTEKHPDLFPDWIHPDLAFRTHIHDKLSDYGVPLGGLPKHELRDFRRHYYTADYFWNNTGNANTHLSLYTGIREMDPTNDVRLIQFCLSIPEEQYVTGGLERSLIRRSTKGILPDAIRFQKGRGIQGIDTVWRMQNNWQKWREEVQALKQNNRLFRYVDPAVFIETADRMPEKAEPAYAGTADFKIISRSMILNQFLQQAERR